jgi:hypothetical protein
VVVFVVVVLGAVHVLQHRANHYSFSMLSSMGVGVSVAHGASVLGSFASTHWK